MRVPPEITGVGGGVVSTRALGGLCPEYVLPQNQPCDAADRAEQSALGTAPTLGDLYIRPACSSVKAPGGFFGAGNFRMCNLAP